MRTLLLTLLWLNLCLSEPEASDTSQGSGGELKDYAQVQLPRGEDIVFSEVFDEDWGDRWVISSDSAFNGQWKVDEGEPPYAVTGDKGLIVDSAARRHAISVPFFKTLDNEDKDLFIQYELRLQKDLDCGGAYIKLLTVNEQLDLKSFNNEVPYTVMFGPDKCGVNNKVHFIVRHKNPISGVYEEKHLKNPPTIKSDRKTHLYTLHILKDNSFKILIDNEEVKSGNLLEDFDPPFNPPAEIDDPQDKKPADWVDEAKIPDSTAVKPDDWDETAPPSIIDVNDKKPDSWLDDELLEIPDPEAVKPADWDDDLDGDWEAPKVPNPKCETGECGTWKPRMITNPAYKGKWKPPLIDNPAYKGEFHPRKIPNPYFFVENHPHNLDKMSALGIELWTMKDGIFFDNFIISYNLADIEQFTRQTWLKKSQDEEAISSAETAENFLSFFQQFVDLINDNLIIVGGLVGFLVLIIVVCLCLPSGKAVPQDKKDKDQAGSHKDKDKKDKDKKEKNDKEKTE